MIIKSISTVNIEEIKQITWVLVETDTGIIGLGETFFGPAAIRGCIHEIFSPMLIGQNPISIEKHWRDMFDMANAFGYAGAELRAISAIDMALWDILGQITNQPIYNLLGGSCRNKIRTYNTAGQYGSNKDSELAIKDAGTLAKSLLDQGITAMKWAFTDHFADQDRGNTVSDEDLNLMIEPIESIRAAVGNSMDVANDGHGRWNLNSAIRIGRAMDDYGLLWQEELIQPTNLENHIILANEIKAPICVSERLMSKFQFREYLKAGVAEIVMPDLIWTGGITETKKISILAEVEQRPVAPHDMTGPVNIFACANICMNIPNAFIMETCRAFYGKEGWYKKYVDPVPIVIDGNLLAPDNPGVGTALRPEVFNMSGTQVMTSSESGDPHWGGFTSPSFKVIKEGGRKRVVSKEK
ncbi:MAG: mandelate racemase/muconate lactonizing enzyme family protein [SAR202 cluster bacterium]|jgi:L-alanine-DL-glutamate epimerase-like enolase superfamily enzyme|nr:mandelate racemase/muconate lactonizing enzyme family protein [Dehalococcoidia bacterium]MQG47650.1 mandelate racemase/muconate lactonizing enzyme family protein [SAR202 cluster bacterium]